MNSVNWTREQFDNFAKDIENNIMRPMIMKPETDYFRGYAQGLINMKLSYYPELEAHCKVDNVKEFHIKYGKQLVINDGEQTLETSIFENRQVD